MNISYFLSQRGKPFWAVIGSLFIAIVGVGDYLSGYELSTSLFYLGPIALVTWYGDIKLGFAACLASAIVWFIADKASGHAYTNSAFPIWNALIRIGFFIIVTLLLEAQKKSHATVLEMARTDYLTGTTNARYFTELAQKEIDRARRYAHPLTLAYIDLDNFKSVNDRRGHTAGDLLLREVAAQIRRNMRSVDIVARLGGDEFALLLPETGERAARAAVAKIQHMLSQTMLQNEWPVTCSIGVVTYLEAPATLDEMVKVADNLMLVVKSSGKDGVNYSVYPLRSG